MRITNLSKQVLPSHIAEIFAHYGNVRAVDVPMHRVWKAQNRGLAFVDYAHEVEAMRAVAAMHKGTLDGCVLDVVAVPARDEARYGAGGDRRTVSRSGSSSRWRSRSPGR